MTRLKWLTWLVALVAVALSMLNLLIEGNLLERCFKVINLLTAPLFVLVLSGVVRAVGQRHRSLAGTAGEHCDGHRDRLREGPGLAAGHQLCVDDALFAAGGRDRRDARQSVAPELQSLE